MKKQVVYFMVVLMLAWACSVSKGFVKVEKSDSEAAGDSLEYELVTFDAKFETWYTLQDVPSKYRSQEYYENWNRQYVAEWNFKSAQPSENSFFETIYGYDPTVDYGFELNHKLFYYFQYVEQVLKIPVLSAGPRSVVF